MKILYFNQHFSTPKGAAGIRSYEMAKRLIERGHEVTVVCGSYSGANTGLVKEFDRNRREGIVDDINVIEFNLEYSNNNSLFKRSLLFLEFALRSIGIAMTRKYDIVFATSTPLTAGIPGIFAKVFRRKKFVFEVRDLWPELPKKMGVIKNPVVLMMMSVLEWVSYHSADRCIGLSPGIVDGIAKRGIDRSKIELVPNGCDLDIFGVNPVSWRPEGVTSTDFMAVFTGTHGLANGLDAVLDAAGVLKERNRPGIKIVLIGQGKLKAKLESRAKSEGLDNIIFCNPVDKAKLAGLMASANLGLQILANIPAFYFGTSPNKFFDYISAGLPVLNNYPGWLADLIVTNDCGFVVPPEDSAAFADALELAASNLEQLKIKGINSKKLAKSQFDRVLLSNKWADWVVGVKNEKIN